MNTDTVICASILAVIALNIAVFLLACRNATRRIRAEQEPSNVVQIEHYRRVDVRV